ncbi:helix-turn-helix transcriptional regulator, partial [Acinetobacter baumannii]
MQKKLFLGHKLRRVREQKALTQAALARQLEVSTSYLN